MPNVLCEFLGSELVEGHVICLGLSKYLILKACHGNAAAWDPAVEGGQTGTSLVSTDINCFNCFTGAAGTPVHPLVRGAGGHGEGAGEGAGAARRAVP
jgi:hypothetical protein